MNNDPKVLTIEDCEIRLQLEEEKLKSKIVLNTSEESQMLEAAGVLLWRKIASLVKAGEMVTIDSEDVVQWWSDPKEV